MRVIVLLTELLFSLRLVWLLEKENLGLLFSA